MHHGETNCSINFVSLLRCCFRTQLWRARVKAKEKKCLCTLLPFHQSTCVLGQRAPFLFWLRMHGRVRVWSGGWVGGVGCCISLHSRQLLGMKIKRGDGEENGKKMRKAQMREAAGRQWSGRAWSGWAQGGDAGLLVCRSRVPPRGTSSGEQLLTAGSRKKGLSNDNCCMWTIKRSHALRNGGQARKRRTAERGQMKDYWNPSTLKIWWYSNTLTAIRYLVSPHVRVCLFVRPRECWKAHVRSSYGPEHDASVDIQSRWETIPCELKAKPRGASDIYLCLTGFHGVGRDTNTLSLSLTHTHTHTVIRIANDTCSSKFSVLKNGRADFPHDHSSYSPSRIHSSLHFNLKVHHVVSGEIFYYDTISYCSSLFMCGGPCHLLASTVFCSFLFLGFVNSVQERILYYHLISTLKM